MIALLGNVNGSELSVINDPFGNDKITNIFISYNIGWGNRSRWIAKVTFKNGLTGGEQNTPECETFEEVVAAVKTILNSVKHR